MQPQSAQDFNALGNALAGKNQLEAAIIAYEQGLAIQKDAVEIHNNLGNALRKIGRAAEAIRAYRKAIFLRPTAPEPHNNLGNTLRGCRQSRRSDRLLSNRPDAATRNVLRVEQSRHRDEGCRPTRRGD